MTSRPFTPTALWISSGVIVWSLHFLAIYGFAAIACARGLGDSRWLGVGVVTIAAIAASVLALALLAKLFVPVTRRWHAASFEDWLATTIAGLSAIGIVWETVPVFIVPPCA